uniref:Uncharacterized protein n=1 Tax=Arundo donax TaxID=35708 RepID=A0A0A9EEA5_ARUDO
MTTKILLPRTTSRPCESASRPDSIARTIDPCTTLSAWSTPSRRMTRKGLTRMASVTRSSAVGPRHDTMDSPPSSPGSRKPRRTVTAPVPKTDMESASAMFLFPTTSGPAKRTHASALVPVPRRLPSPDLTFVIVLATAAAASGCHLTASVSRLTSSFSSMSHAGLAGAGPSARSVSTVPPDFTDGRTGSACMLPRTLAPFHSEQVTKDGRPCECSCAHRSRHRRRSSSASRAFSCARSSGRALLGVAICSHCDIGCSAGRRASSDDAIFSRSRS